MRISPFRSSDVKLNVRVRDFFVDFLACLIPGFIFLVASTLILIGFIYINFMHYIYPADEEGFEAIFASLKDIGEILSLKFWIYIGIIILSYVVGHLLYRQDPKEPDYYSFIKIRKKVMGYNDWVIAKGDGLIPDDVQFPYSNLKNYLEARNFAHLFEYIKWDTRIEKKDDEKNDGEEKNDDKSRSKSFINQLKTRIHFFYPESTFNIIKNEAHIRLASSMWYASKYILLLFYYTLPILILYIVFLMLSAGFFEFSGDSVPVSENMIRAVCTSLVLISILFLFRGVSSRLKSQNIIDDVISQREEDDREWNSEDMEPEIALCSEEIYKGYLRFDRFPLFCAMSLLLTILIMYFHGAQEIRVDISPFSIYVIILLIIVLGTLFMKHRIEDTFHYQRVREIIFVLETAHLACVLSDDDVNKIRKDVMESFNPLHTPPVFHF